MEIDLIKIKAFSAAALIVVVCGVIIPGFFFLFIYDKELFFALDLFRLSVLSISITFPIVFLNGFISHIGFNDPDIHDEKYINKGYIANFYSGSIFTMPVLYSSIIIGYFFDLNIKQGILILAIAEIIILFPMYFVIYRKQ